MLAIIIFRKQPVTPISNQEQLYKDSITLLKSDIDLSHKKQARLQGQYDSLSALEQPIIYRTNEKIKFILTDATPDELDSTIKSLIKPRYR
jgi:hypothetical protein